MKFSILQSKFIEGLKTVQNVVATKTTMPVLQNVLLEACGKELKMTTTDLDISINTSCDCEVQEAGSTTLPVKLLFNAISKMNEGKIEISVDANDLAHIVAGSANFKMAGIPAQTFPRLPKSDDTFAYTVAPATLKEMFRKVAYASSEDDTRRTLKGVLMSFKESKLTMVATDGRRLAMVENEMEIPQDAEVDIVLPSKAVIELQRSLGTGDDISIMINKSQICVKMEKVSIFSKLIEEQYPNYKQVIPTETVERIDVDRQLLLDALERTSVMTLDENHSTRLAFSSGKLVVSSAVSDIGEAKDEVPIKYAGETIEIVFNPNFVMDALRAIDDDEISINLNNGHSPAVIKCSIPFLYVLMPLRIS